MVADSTNSSYRCYDTTPDATNVVLAGIRRKKRTEPPATGSSAAPLGVTIPAFRRASGTVHVTGRFRSGMTTMDTDARHRMTVLSGGLKDWLLSVAGIPHQRSSITRRQE
jgi:hypothetical protein